MSDKSAEYIGLHGWRFGLGMERPMFEGEPVALLSDVGGAGDLEAGTNIQIADDVVSSTATTKNTQTATYTLVLTDAGKVVEMDVGSANDLTVPPNSSVAFATGTIISIYQKGAGQTTVVAGSGVTIRARNGLKLAGQFAEASLRKRDTNEWVLVGDVTT